MKYLNSYFFDFKNIISEIFLEAKDHSEIFVSF